MKFLVLFSVLVVAVTALDTQDGRYIWLSGHSTSLKLVDLQEPVKLDPTRSGANNQYWLFTRSNPTTAQVLVHGNVNSVRNSNYDSRRQIKVLVHGWNGNGNNAMNRDLTAAFLAVGNFNVIVVDWNRVANQNYVSAVAGVPGVGQHLGEFLLWLINTSGGNWNNVHLVGFSLGAHVVGNAGRAAGGRPARITGLDPAGPLWQINRNALTASDGVYVESIHTDGGLQGIFNPISNADFYPNGGRNPQPGCSNSACSHGRAVHLFASSVRTNHLLARQCTNISQAENNACIGSSFHLGNSLINKRGDGLFALTTGSSWPF